MATPARLAEVADYCARVATGDYADHVRRFGPRVETIYKGVTEGHTDPSGFQWPTRPDRSMTVDPRDPDKEKRLDNEFKLFIMASCQDAAIVNRWKRHRIVYNVHPDLAAELADTDPASIIPAGLVKHLPHPDPFLALAEPVVIPLSKRLPGDKGVAVRVLGAFLYGLTDTNAIVSTTDSHAVTMGLQLAQQVIDAQGRPVSSQHDGSPDFAWARMNLPPVDMTLSDLTAQVTKRFIMATVHNDGLPDNQEIVSKLLAAVVPQVIYLCATNAETRPVPAVALRRKPDGTSWKGKPPRVIEVGYRLGPILGKARKTYTKDPTAVGSGGWKMPPHVRRAHYQRFWTGPRSGPQVAIVRWIAPTPVNVDRDADKTVIVGVDRPQPAADPIHRPEAAVR